MELNELKLQSLSIEELIELRAKQFRELKQLPVFSDAYFEKLHELKATSGYLNFLSSKIRKGLYLSPN